MWRRLWSPTEAADRIARGVAHDPPGMVTAESATVQRNIAERRAVYPKDMARGAEVPRRSLERMLQAARWAPTHKVTQPWRFVVLGGEQKDAFEALSIDLVEKYQQDPEKREATLKKMRRKREGDWKNVYCYIAIVLRRSTGPSPPPEWEEAAAVAMAVQNLWLTAWAEGVHGYWSSWQPPARDALEMLDFLGLRRETDKLMGFFVAGIADKARLASYRGRRSLNLGDYVQWRLDDPPADDDEEDGMDEK